MNRKVLIVGGSGHFGRLLAEDLRRYAACEPILADRSWSDESLRDVDVAICTAGPFQTLPTTLAEACLRHASHYIDFADDRNFVRRVHTVVDKHGSPQSAVC